MFPPYFLYHAPSKIHPKYRGVFFSLRTIEDNECQEEFCVNTGPNVFLFFLVYSLIGYPQIGKGTTNELATS